MPHSRFFLRTYFQKHSVVHLEGDEAHHVQHVMRKREADVIQLVNGCNQLGLAKILGFEKKRICLQVLDVVEKPPSCPAIILCQAIPRLNRLETIVEKGTELGMGELWLFPGQLSEKKELNAVQLKRLELISIAAMKQSGRLDLPKIELYPSVLDWEYQENSFYFGDISETAPYFTSIQVTKNPTLTYKEESRVSEHEESIDTIQVKNILFCVGPESGFTDQEQNHLRKINGIGIRLHPNILRTDTAALMALSLISVWAHNKE